MREKFTAKVIRFTQKRYYTSVGLPYSTVLLSEISRLGQTVEGLTVTEIRYTQTFHNLGINSGDILEFVAEVDRDALSSERRIVFKRVTQLRCVSKAATT